VLLKHSASPSFSWYLTDLLSHNAFVAGRMMQVYWEAALIFFGLKMVQLQLQVVEATLIFLGLKMVQLQVLAKGGLKLFH